MRHLISTALAAALPLLSLAWALDLFRAVGLVLFAEQILAAILALALPLVFLGRDLRGAKRQKHDAAPYYDVVAGLVGFLAAGYVTLNYSWIFETLFERPVDATIAGGLLIVLVLEALRRSAGAFLAIVVAVFLLYGLVGHLVPGDLQGRQVALDRLTVYLSIDSNGMLGLPLMVTATAVVMFVLFGAFLTASGGGKFFTDLSMAGMGRYRGGPAKIAITASALFGSISGSAVANVASTGIVTIPMMKDAGFKPRIAGAIEAVASTGGQLMPPVMGAAAFLMAEFLQVGYGTVITAALIPALLYFLAVFVQADLISARDGIAAMDPVDIPRVGRVMLSGWYFIIPFAVLIGALFWFGQRPEAAAFWASAAMLPLGLLLRYQGNGLTLTNLWNAIISTGNIVVDIVMIGAAAGLIIGVLNITSLGFALTLSLVDFAGGSLPILLVLSAVLSIILGMGMPTVGVYILLATLVAPTLIELGVQPLSAHLFVLYFGMMSMITPPVAIAAFTASVIAKAKPVATSVQAIRLGWAAYVVPFIFIYEPAILMNGTNFEIVIASLRVGLGVWVISGCLVGQLFGQLGPVRRSVFALVGLSVLIPSALLPAGDWAAIASLVLAFVAILFDFLTSRARTSNT